MTRAQGNERQATTVVLFDGVCGLCNRSINWIIDRDPSSRIRFLPFQSPAGEALAEDVGLNPKLLTTMVAIQSGRVMLRSTAVLHVGSRLETPLARLAKLFVLVPTVLRDLGYRVVARTRYAFFGKLEACRMPTPDLASRFLDTDDVAAAFREAGRPGTGRVSASPPQTRAAHASAN